MKIQAHGQIERVLCIVKENNKDVFYLEKPIIVPGIEYTRDYVYEYEIQKYIQDDESNTRNS